MTAAITPARGMPGTHLGGIRTFPRWRDGGLKRASGGGDVRISAEGWWWGLGWGLELMLGYVGRNEGRVREGEKARMAETREGERF